MRRECNCCRLDLARWRRCCSGEVDRGGVWRPPLGESVAREASGGDAIGLRGVQGGEAKMDPSS